jgi:hypothetical protein
MALDLQRIIEAAARAALDDSNSGRGSAQGSRQSSAHRGRRRLTGTRAFLIGAGAVTAGRLVTAARRGDLLEGIQQRLLDYEHRHFGEDADEEPHDDFEEEPGDEFDEPDEADDDEPDQPDDEDEEDEPEPAASGGERSRRRA